MKSKSLRHRRGDLLVEGDRRRIFRFKPIILFEGNKVISGSAMAVKKSAA